MKKEVIKQLEKTATSYRDQAASMIKLGQDYENRAGEIEALIKEIKLLPTLPQKPE